MAKLEMTGIVDKEVEKQKLSYKTGENIKW